MADAIFEDPRLAQVYDPLDPDRSDLDVYVQLVDELGARSVLDIGCGTGTFACALAQRGIDVIAVDPAGASLDVARAKPGAEGVRWQQGDATTLPPLRVDAAFMTANVAQVISAAAPAPVRTRSLLCSTIERSAFTHSNVPTVFTLTFPSSVVKRAVVTVAAGGSTAVAAGALRVQK